jgi:hypothetical protein
MNVFLCHATEDRAVAEAIQLALTEAGFNVFFSPQSLPAAADYQDQIQKAISACDLFVFLASGASTAPGKFTLSELSLANKKWPSPVGRVLTVLLNGLPPTALPPYAAAVTALAPSGNPAVEVRVAVNALATAQRSRRFRRWTALLVLVGFGATGIALVWHWVQTPTSTVSRSSNVVSSDSDQFRRIYYQGFDFSEANADAVANAMNDGWLIGKRGDWEGHVSGGQYRLCNVSNSASASYTSSMSHEVSGQKTSLKDATVSVRVRVEPPNGTYSGAGILFRKLPDKPDYLAYMLQAGTAASLLRRRDASLSVLASKELPSPGTSDLVTLRLVAAGPHLDLYADNKLIYSSTKERAVDLLEGDPGIFAYSTGCFVFDDFAIYTRAQ